MLGEKFITPVAIVLLGTLLLLVGQHLWFTWHYCAGEELDHPTSNFVKQPRAIDTGRKLLRRFSPQKRCCDRLPQTPTCTCLTPRLCGLHEDQIKFILLSVVDCSVVRTRSYVYVGQEPTTKSAEFTFPSSFLYLCPCPFSSPFRLSFSSSFSLASVEQHRQRGISLHWDISCAIARSKRLECCCRYCCRYSLDSSL